MSRLEDLPPDLHAVLSLVLRQRKTYAEIATMLGIEERAVHDRAHAALAMLDPRRARELTASQREQVGEYLLGQADPAGRSQTLANLEGTAPAREWAHALAAELAPLVTEPLPEIPTGSSAGERAAAAAAGASAGGVAGRTSRVGGMVVLGVTTVVVIAAVI
ncbi:MAG: sigma factor-like helix-turn-helix DNA-binding protein, partial [Solirubrobacteraceae bacterium]